MIPAPHDRPQPDGSDLRPVQAADVPALAVTLARAFNENPGMSWVVPDPAKRPVRLERLFGVLLEHFWVPHGECTTTVGVEGAALWMPPGLWHLPAPQGLRLLPRLTGAVRGNVTRAIRGAAITDAMHPSDPPHWYLAVLGVDPPAQGRGFGSHLLAPGLRRCDENSMPAYLETDTERNVAMYERHGFEVVGEVALPGGTPIWLMWRGVG